MVKCYVCLQSYSSISYRRNTAVSLLKNKWVWNIFCQNCWYISESNIFHSLFPACIRTGFPLTQKTLSQQFSPSLTTGFVVLLGTFWTRLVMQTLRKVTFLSWMALQEKCIYFVFFWKMFRSHSEFSLVLDESRRLTCFVNCPSQVPCNSKPPH